LPDNIDFLLNVTSKFYFYVARRNNNEPCSYHKQAKLLLILSILCLYSITQAQTIFVDSSVAVSGDGRNWASAYKELRDALKSIRTNNSITEIAVAKGSYKSTDDANFDSAFCIYRGNIKIYGAIQVVVEAGILISTGLL
jgi:hypothetical protein